MNIISKNKVKIKTISVVLIPRIELGTSPYQGLVIPFNYTSEFGGRYRIRTYEPLLTTTCFPGKPYRPLRQSSLSWFRFFLLTTHNFPPRRPDSPLEILFAYRFEAFHAHCTCVRQLRALPSNWNSTREFRSLHNRDNRDKYNFLPNCRILSTELLHPQECYLRQEDNPTQIA